MSNDVWLRLTASKAVDDLALKGSPFTFAEAVGEANEAAKFPRTDYQSACYRLVDRHLQMRRKAGHFRCERKGRTWDWIITSTGYGALQP